MEESEKYERVWNEKREADPTDPTEIRITGEGRVQNYLSYGIKLLQVWRQGESIVNLPTNLMGRRRNRRRRLHSGPWDVQ
jgi:hypothetical protein